MAVRRRRRVRLFPPRLVRAPWRRRDHAPLPANQVAHPALAAAAADTGNDNQLIFILMIFKINANETNRRRTITSLQSMKYLRISLKIGIDYEGRRRYFPHPKLLSTAGFRTDI
jgi:hypothetical protein